jgi:hypothetical protein
VHVILETADTALGIAALYKWQFGILKEFFVVHGVPDISGKDADDKEDSRQGLNFSCRHIVACLKL